MLTAILLAPLAVVDMPPLLDYPNHLARAYVLAFGAADPALSKMYAPHWAIIPNLAVDALLPPLLHVLPVHVAGRLLLAVTLLLPVAGTLLYSRATFGHWYVWPLGAFLVSTNGLFLLGFVNFQLGVGLALISAAAWIGLRDQRPTGAVLVGMVAATALFFTHMTGLGLYLILLAAHEAERIGSRLRQGATLPRATIPAACLVPVVLLPLALYAASPFSDQPSSPAWETARDKVIRAAMPFIAYDLPLDLAAAALLAAVVVACVAARRMEARPSGGLALGALALLFVVAPFGLKGTGYLDARFSVMLGFLVFACLRPRFDRRASVLLAAGFLAVFVLRTARIAEVWAAHRDDLAQLREAIADVTPGEKVLVGLVGDDEAIPEHAALLRRQSLADGSRLDTHTAALLLIERHAFWPALFARPEQQPIMLRAPYAGIATLTAGLPNLHLLTATQPDAADRATFPIGAAWDTCYDALLLMEAGASNFAPPGLLAIRRSDYATLFRVRPESRATPCPVR